MKLYCEHNIPMSAELFWEHIHDPRYEQMVGQAIGLNAYDAIETRDEGDTIYRKIRVEPQIPAQFESLLKKVAKNVDSGYTEEQWRHKDKMEVDWQIILGFAKERAEFKGVVRIEPIDDHSCKRILDGKVEIKILGLGKVLEKTVVSQTIDGYGKSAAVAQDYKEKYLES